MKHLNWIKFVLISSIFTLTACTHKTTSPTAYDQENSAYNANRPQVATLEQESSFNEQEKGGKNLLSRKIYYFDFDSNVVHDNDKPAINANADYLLAHSRAKVLLEGHTDPRGSREYNIGLGERRAKSVAAILIAKGVSPSQIKIVSYGAEKLAAPGRTEADYQLDRRVVLVYVKR